MSWIYQRFPQWCPNERNVVVFPLTSRLNGLRQQIKIIHETRMVRTRGRLSVPHSKLNSPSVLYSSAIHSIDGSSACLVSRSSS
ncbi:hypothetical protein PIB30_086832 [Stylosanthes scabra]|uniref:Uncharacterized protein n=1 Tax=Stylosanthes scabra TaxID=79078 RepID=A0ABU6QT89_9FABA|nr:hypothetical protein [Stylosanthes scabra]